MTLENGFIAQVKFQHHQNYILPFKIKLHKLHKIGRHLYHSQASERNGAIPEINYI